MKLTRTKSSSKKKLLIIVIVAAVLVAGAVAAFSLTRSPRAVETGNNNTDKSKVDYSAPTDEQKNAGTNAKNETVNPTPPPNPTNGKQITTVVITKSSQESGGDLRIGAYAQVIDSQASCGLTLTKGSKTITKTSAVITQSSFSSCADFNIDRSELTEGAWNATVTYTSEGFSGSQSQAVEIK